MAGFKRKKKTVILEFENDNGEFAGLEVEVASMPMGDFLDLSKLVSKDDMTDDDIRVVIEAFAKVLVSWNLEEDDGTPTPTTVDGLLLLDLEFVMKLVGTWMSVISGPNEDLGKGSASGETFPGRPLTMEAL